MHPSLFQSFSDLPTTSRAVPAIAAISCWVSRGPGPFISGMLKQYLGYPADNMLEGQVLDQ